MKLTKYLKYKERVLLRCIYHFETESINNMDNMRIGVYILVEANFNYLVSVTAEGPESPRGLL